MNQVLRGRLQDQHTEQNVHACLLSCSGRHAGMFPARHEIDGPYMLLHQKLGTTVLSNKSNLSRGQSLMHANEGTFEVSGNIVSPCNPHAETG